MPVILRVLTSLFLNTANKIGPVWEQIAKTNASSQIEMFSQKVAHPGSKMKIKNVKKITV